MKYTTKINNIGKQWALSFVFSTALLTSTVGQMTTTEAQSNVFSSLFGQKDSKSEVLEQSLNQIRLMTSDSITERPAASVRKITRNPANMLSVWATAYTSDPAETDDTPFITASGTITRDGVAAANFLPIGTKFKMPQHYGDKIFVVEDRMNPRYNGQQIVDIWFTEKTDARIFGKRAVQIELL